MSSFVLTVLAHDRPGLVAALSDTISAHGGCWAESQLSRLAGSFAGVLLVDIDPQGAPALATALQGLREAGVLEVTLAPAHEQADDPTPGQERLRLQLTGQDRPGIVRDVSRILAERQVSIDQLVTSTQEAPMSGGMLFTADAMIRLPAATDSAQVRAALEAIAAEIMVEITLDEQVAGGTAWGASSA